MKYEKAIYEKKDKKRQIEKDIVKRCLRHGIKGKYIGLTGPAWDTHLKTWGSVAKTFQSIELDKGVYLSQRHQYNNIENKKGIKIPIWSDIFKYLLDYKGKVAILDIDLCGLYDTFEDKVYTSVEKLLRNNQFTFKCALVVCFSTRGNVTCDVSTLTGLFIDDIKKLFKQHGYNRCYGADAEPYKEGIGHSPMIEFTFYFERRY